MAESDDELSEYSLTDDDGPAFLPGQEEAEVAMGEGADNDDEEEDEEARMMREEAAADPVEVVWLPGVEWGDLHVNANSYGRVEHPHCFPCWPLILM